MSNWDVQHDFPLEFNFTMMPLSLTLQANWKSNGVWSWPGVLFIIIIAIRGKHHMLLTTWEHIN